MSDHPVDLGFWAEGVTVEGERLTLEESRAFIDELASMTDTIESEKRRSRGDGR